MIKLLIYLEKVMVDDTHTKACLINNVSYLQ